MDPLVIAGGVGEQVHLLLRDLVPIAVTDVLADELLEPLDAFDGEGHLNQILSYSRDCGCSSRSTSATSNINSMTSPVAKTWLRPS